MKIAFIIQGEGRGHLSQALALAPILEAAGWEICAVLIGQSRRRQLPAYVQAGFRKPVLRFASPNFALQRGARGISYGRTLWENLLRLPQFVHSLRVLHRYLDEAKPDIILNFYDLLPPLYRLLYPQSARYWCIGHQYTCLLPDFPAPKGQRIARALFRALSAWTARGAERLLVLHYAGERRQEGRALLMPPLLRPEVYALQPTAGDYLLAYAVNYGYAEELKQVAVAHPEWQLRAFWDHPEHPEPFQAAPNLCFYPLDGQHFLAQLAGAKAFLSTAGFESICEALYLGKPVAVLPVAGQYEQHCNAEELALLQLAHVVAEFHPKALLADTDDVLSSVRYPSQGEAEKMWQNTFHEAARPKGFTETKSAEFQEK
ncbi:MAG: glycosyltransferase family protein [Nitritalea sp.]